ncbi:hypothetical protein [Nocardioides sp. BYT-33-1]|uniref:hypothetical protein n=1 Tax=Nocardioides sp. BYT-33-1 TaxID=3416952 RepID=UPI003F53763F
MLTPQTIIDHPDQLRTGGVNCARPEPLPAGNAGDGGGHGYRVPFLMSITDGRALAGYSAAAKAHGQFPFGTGAVGITGWVRGWMTLPSLEVVVPDDGVTLCGGTGAYWSRIADLETPEAGTFVGLAACPAPCWLQALFDVAQDGPVRAAVTGVAADGSLEFEAAMAIAIRIRTRYGSGGDQATMDCTTRAELSLATAPAPLIQQFRPIPSPFTDRSQWTPPANYDLYFKPEYPIAVDPPERYYMPPRALDGAIVGGSATLADARVLIPAARNSPAGSPLPRGLCASADPAAGGVSLVSTLLDVKDARGHNAIPAQAYISEGAPQYVGWDVQPGAVQTSIDLTIADIGMPTGLPSGFGFS